MQELESYGRNFQPINMKWLSQQVFTNCLRRGIGDQAQSWLETMQALTNVNIIPVSIEIATNCCNFIVILYVIVALYSLYLSL